MRKKIFFLSIFLFGMFSTVATKDVKSGTKICPNSSVKCNVTVNTEEHGKITVESEKGKNDSAVVIESD